MKKTKLAEKKMYNSNESIVVPKMNKKIYCKIY